MLRPTCQAIRNNKKPCNNYAKKGSDFCGVHKHDDLKRENEKLKQEKKKLQDEVNTLLAELMKCFDELVEEEDED
jgi:FtsZ-binding cell division protein ZapB